MLSSLQVDHHFKMMIILFLMVTVPVVSSTGETFLVGPMDFDGFCPEPSHKYGKSCCCAAGCCWSNCRTADPPLSCLDGVPNSQWVFNRDKLWYQAVRNFNHQGTFPQCLKITEKVSFNIASEASYIDKSSLKMPKMVNLGEFLKISS